MTLDFDRAPNAEERTLLDACCDVWFSAFEDHDQMAQVYRNGDHSWTSPSQCSWWMDRVQPPGPAAEVVGHLRWVIEHLNRLVPVRRVRLQAPDIDTKFASHLGPGTVIVLKETPTTASAIGGTVRPSWIPLVLLGVLAVARRAFDLPPWTTLVTGAAVILVSLFVSRKWLAGKYLLWLSGLIAAAGTGGLAICLLYFDRLATRSPADLSQMELRQITQWLEMFDKLSPALVVSMLVWAFLYDRSARRDDAAP